MTGTRWERIKDTFNAALAVPMAERGALVERLCAGDAELRREVESLLSARTLSIVRTAGAAAAVAAMSTTGPSDPYAQSRVGTMIGRYKLLQIIGEGGFGTVYMAEQTEPVRRRVALKIIKPGMDSKAIIARFEAERQALALMDHPHIARVLDGGVTPLAGVGAAAADGGTGERGPATGERGHAPGGGGGLPYFVMEYVIGDPITTFADAHALSIADRLTVFRQVCSAVQHAHTKGIIHRDLKPGNVLVSTVDDKPFAKVIDFGIAKATGGAGLAGGGLTDRTLFTEHRMLLGTPEYMSPEQAEGSPDIDTRTDVYALGVLLYELLTGSTPIDSERLRRAAFDEMRRIIREEEPPSPSIRLSRSLDRLAATAASRGAEPARLGALVRGELDWIVMRALEKERARRYETASALGDDVARHLAGEPIIAAPVSRAYRVRKFVRRNRGAVGAGAAIAATLVVGIAGTTWQWKHATERGRELEATSRHVLQALDDADWNLREHVGLQMKRVQTSDGADPNTIEGQIDMLSVRLGVAAAIAQERQFQLKNALDAAEWSAYTANLALAQAAIEAGDYPEARRRLAAAPQSKRSWEWHIADQISKSIQFKRSGEWESATLANTDLVVQVPLGGRRSAWSVESGAEVELPSDTEPLLHVGLREGESFSFRNQNIDPRAAAIVGPQSRDTLRRGWMTGQGRFLVVVGDYRHDPFAVQVFDVSSRRVIATLNDVGYYLGGAAVSADGRWLLMLIVSAMGVGQPGVTLVDLAQDHGSASRWLGDGSRAALAVDVVLSQGGSGPSGLAITTPDGRRRIVGGADKTVRFYEAKEGKPTLPATTEQPEGVYREVAVFRMPEAVTNLQMTGDGTRLIIHLDGGSARVWDIRDPEERRKDLQAEWAERVPAGAYLDTLWASDTPDEKLRDAVIKDASLTPLRRLVAAEMLEERQEDDLLAAEEAFEKMKQAAVPASSTAGATLAADPASITSAVRDAAAAADLPPRVEARVIALAAGWEYKKPEPSDAERLAEETKQRRLAEAQATVLRIRSTVDEIVTSPDHLRDLREAATQIESIVGANDRRSAEAWLEFALWANDPTDAKDAAMRVVGVYSPPTADLLQAKAWCALAEVEAKSGNIVESAAWLRRFASFIADLPLTATTDGNEWFWWSSAGTVRLARLGPRLVYEARLGAGADMRTSLARAAKRLLASDVEAFVAVASVSDVMSHRVPLDGALQGVFRWHQHRAAVGESDSPSALGILAIVRWTIGAKATDATLAAAAEIDGKPNSLTGGKVLDREGHRAAAREALARARALMAPAADGTPSPWVNDQDAKALLAEAAALIEGQPGEPATPAKDDK